MGTGGEKERGEEGGREGRETQASQPQDGE